jgi:hypothetical protein
MCIADSPIFFFIAFIELTESIDCAVTAVALIQYNAADKVLY